MDKDNSQESMISSNSLSFGKNRGEAYYSSNPTFYVGIDCIIFGFNEGEISLLLLKRNFEPAMGEWSLMGGFVQNNESCLLYTSPSPRDRSLSRMPSSA